MDAPIGQMTKQYGLVPPEMFAGMSGLELLQGMVEGRFPGSSDHAAHRLWSG